MNEDTLKLFLGSVARHGLTSAATVLAAHGYIGSSQTEQFVGAGLFFAGLGWSWWQKKGHAQAAAQLDRLLNRGVKAVIFALAVLVGLNSGRADATDLPSPVVKARALPAPGYPVGCGLFWGADTQGAGGAVAGAPIGTNTLDGEIGLLAGYTCPLANDGSAGWFVEADFNFVNLNGNTSGFALSGPASFEQRFAVFGGIDKILAVFPSLNLPAFPSTPLLPAGVTAGPAQVYVFGAAHEQDISAQFGLDRNRDWLFSPGVGFGTLTRWSNGLVVDVWIENQFRSSGMTVGPTKVALKDMIRAGIAFKY